jgi:hypothetical protein
LEETMGDAQFDGGGSVKWKVRPSKGNPGQGNPHGASGKDDDPVGPGFFKVFDNDNLVHETTETVGHIIKVEWGPESAPPTAKLTTESRVGAATSKGAKTPSTATKSAISKPISKKTARRATTTKKTARSAKKK